MTVDLKYILAPKPRGHRELAISVSPKQYRCLNFDVCAPDYDSLVEKVKSLTSSREAPKGTSEEWIAFFNSPEIETHVITGTPIGTVWAILRGES